MQSCAIVGASDEFRIKSSILPGRGVRSRRLLLGKFSVSLCAEEIALSLGITLMAKRNWPLWQALIPPILGTVILCSGDC